MNPDSGIPVISVVIVNFNGRRWLSDCLAATADQQGVSFEIVLVDNASTDDSVALVQKQFPAVRIVPLPRNTGFAGGNNAGVRASRGEYIALLNNDTKPEPGWLAALYGALQHRPDAGLATSRIVFMHDPDLIDSAGDGLTRAGGAFKRGHGQRAASASTGRDVFGACGAACLIRSAVFDELNGFDDDYFMVWEDVDLSYRAQLRGYACIYVPDAVVRHAGSGSLGVLSPTAVFLGQRNLEWTYLKNTPAPILVGTLPAHLVYNTAALAYFARHGRLRAFVAGKWAAVRAVRTVWRKRREVQRTRRVPLSRLWSLMEPGWIGLKRREKRFTGERARRS